MNPAAVPPGGGLAPLTGLTGLSEVRRDRAMAPGGRSCRPHVEDRWRWPVTMRAPRPGRRAEISSGHISATKATVVKSNR